MLFPPSCPGMDSGVSTPLAVSNSASMILGILSPLSCTSLWEPPGKGSFGAEENPSRSSQPLVFRSQNQPVGATVGMLEVSGPGVLVCWVSLGLSLAWWGCPVCQDVPGAWHSRVGTAAALVGAGVTRCSLYPLGVYS